jgi:hypothetical protein
LRISPCNAVFELVAWKLTLFTGIGIWKTTRHGQEVIREPLLPKAKEKTKKCGSSLNKAAKQIEKPAITCISSCVVRRLSGLARGCAFNDPQILTLTLDRQQKEHSVSIWDSLKYAEIRANYLPKARAAILHK